MAAGAGSNYTRKQLEEKLRVLADSKNEEIFKLRDLLEEKNKEIAEKTARLKVYEDAEILLGTEEQIIKFALEFRARGDDVSLIKEKIAFRGRNVSIKEIETICKNIESLDIEYREHYNRCVKDFENEVRLNPETLKLKNIENNLFLIDETKKMISESIDPSEKLKYINMLNQLIKTNNDIIKETIIGDIDSTNSDRIASIKEGIKKRNKKIMGPDFDPSKFKVLKKNG